MKVYRYNYNPDGTLAGGFEEFELTLKLQIID
jgi:hypothetical protein